MRKFATASFVLYAGPSGSSPASLGESLPTKEVRKRSPKAGPKPIPTEASKSNLSPNQIARSPKSIRRSSDTISPQMSPTRMAKHALEPKASRSVMSPPKPTCRQTIGKPNRNLSKSKSKPRISTVKKSHRQARSNSIRSSNRTKYRAPISSAKPSHRGPGPCDVYRDNPVCKVHGQWLPFKNPIRPITANGQPAICSANKLTKPMPKETPSSASNCPQVSTARCSSRRTPTENPSAQN